MSDQPMPTASVYGLSEKVFMAFTNDQEERESERAS